MHGPALALFFRVSERLRPYAPALVASLFLCAACVRGILKTSGHPAAPLDDAFIHFQYAKQIASGSFFGYSPNEGYSSGATSFLWPLFLAPFYRVGFRDLSILYIAWFVGTLAHAGLAVETARIVRRLAGPAAALAAAAMCLGFGAFAWFAWSGMETIPFSYCLMRTARLAAEYAEPLPNKPPPSARELVVMGIVTPLLRPEGAIASLLAALALAGNGTREPGDERSAWSRFALALAPLAGPLIHPLVHLAFSGHFASSTAAVKWLWLHPTLSRDDFFEASFENARQLLGPLLGGTEWTTVFMPEGGRVFFLLGALALPVAAYRRRLTFHGAVVALVAFGSFLPCTYSSFLWNRLRYVWPFAPSWFVLLACFAQEIGDVARLVRPRLVAVTPVIGGIFAGALATHLPWSIGDLAQSAHAVDQQQVELGRWVRAELPEGARIGVNDTGAIAYIGGRRTFDIVGLTTEGEARYWIAGAGSRFEHYERMSREALPTHFIVYPLWMGCSAVLGRALTERTVVDQTILGGATMVAYESRWDRLGSGARPWTPVSAIVDEVDVSDLESEKEHAYTGGSEDIDNQVMSDANGQVVDGGRFNRTHDQFTGRFGSLRRARLVLRVGADVPTQLRVLVDGRSVGSVRVPGEPFTEVSLAFDTPGGNSLVEVLADESDFSAFHYWIVADLEK